VLWLDTRLGSSPEERLEPLMSGASDHASS
jgi:hypothetical protein